VLFGPAVELMLHPVKGLERIVDSKTFEVIPTALRPSHANHRIMGPVNVEHRGFGDALRKIEPILVCEITTAANDARKLFLALKSKNIFINLNI
jgi:hypothetical protein